MAYFAPFIDETGIHVPTYEDIRDELISQMKTIFGTDIYIAEDTQDYQQISIFAKKIFDTNSLAVLAYNNRTPITAIGVGLDNICALAGIKRKPATYSTVQLTITGTPGTVITNGSASDGEHNWILPDTVTIPDNGIINVDATSEIIGRIIAPPNTVTIINTPVYGWEGVTNNYSATPGVNYETDASLRARYAKSTAAPSNSVFESMISAVESVTGVTRVKAYENDTGETSDEGFPPHSVTFVVEGGDTEQIATEILYKKTPGCYTNGTTSYTLVSITGNQTTIRFYRPTTKNVYAKIYLTKLPGYNSEYENKIKNAIVDYISGLQIADDIYRSIIWSVATSQMDSIVTPAFSVTNVTLSTDGVTYTQADIVTDFNEAALSSVDNIEVVVS